MKSALYTTLLVIATISTVAAQNDPVHINGRLGIGIDAPASALHIVGTSNAGDINLEDNFPFVIFNTLQSSAYGGLVFKFQGANQAFITHNQAADAIFISGQNNIQAPDICINNQGYVGIGLDNPLFPFHLGTDTFSIAGLELAKLGTTKLGLDGDVIPYDFDGGFDLGNNDADEHWDDCVAAEFITFSDRSVKDDLADLEVGLNEVLALHPVQYRYKPNITPDDRIRYGFIAQEAEQVMPTLVVQEDVDRDTETGEVIRTPTELKAMNYMDLIPVLVQSIQEQQKYIDELEKRIQKLEGN